VEAIFLVVLLFRRLRVLLILLPAFFSTITRRAPGRLNVFEILTLLSQGRL
jgi:hypothetical protein